MTMALGTLNIIGQQTQALTAGQVTGLVFNPGVEAVAGTVPAAKIRPRHAIIAVEGNAVRWGLAPSAISGILVAAGGQLSWTDCNVDFSGLLTQIKFISMAGPATLQIQYLD